MYLLSLFLSLSQNLFKATKIADRICRIREMHRAYIYSIHFHLHDQSTNQHGHFEKAKISFHIAIDHRKIDG